MWDSKERLRERIMMLLRFVKEHPHQDLIILLRRMHYARYGTFGPCYSIFTPMSRWERETTTVLGRAIYNLERSLWKHLERKETNHVRNC